MTDDPVHKTTQDLRGPIDTLRRLISDLRAYFEAMVDDIDWNRVADAITERMGELTLTQGALAELADVSPITIRYLTKSGQDSYRRDTLVKVSTALGWGPDGLVRIGRGEDPAAVEVDLAMGDQSDVFEILKKMQDQLDRIEAEVSRLREDRDAAGDPG